MRANLDLLLQAHPIRREPITRPSHPKGTASFHASQQPPRTATGHLPAPAAAPSFNPADIATALQNLQAQIQALSAIFLGASGASFLAPKPHA